MQEIKMPEDWLRFAVNKAIEIKNDLDKSGGDMPSKLRADMYYLLGFIGSIRAILPKIEGIKMKTLLPGQLEIPMYDLPTDSQRGRPNRAARGTKKTG